MPDKDESKKFDDGNRFCLISFFVLGNYLALIGLVYSNKAFQAYMQGDILYAKKCVSKARAWAIWGLIPSTILNAYLIYLTYLIISYILGSFLRGI